MSYVIYNVDTTIIATEKNRKLYSYDSFTTESAAKAALTRMVKKGKIKNRDEYAISEVIYFHNNIEKKETRKGIGPADGKTFTVGVNTPWTSGPWSETYWSS